jgi:hypothetical protein
MLMLSDFLGSWQMSRWIDDRLAGRKGRFVGTARLELEGQGARYREEGTLRLGEGPALAATRGYLWLPAEGGIEVRFADGRPFHRFTPHGRAPGTDHPCGRDFYRVTYDLTYWPSWETVWTVTGPAKDYIMATRYARG